MGAPEKDRPPGGGAPGAAAAPGFAMPAESRAALWWLLGLLVAWSSWFIYRTSFVAGGQRVFCLFDDAMISMAYARNLLAGYGLNWARSGRPVEGFTHPLWTALMVPVNALPLALRYRSLVVQAMSLALLAANVVLVRRLVLRFFSTERARHWLPAALLTAFYYPLDYWSLVGMETGLQALLVTASVLLAFDIVCRGRDRQRELLLVGAAAYLLRMDMLLMVAVVQGFVIACGGRRVLGARFWQGLAALAAVIAGSSALRWFYFGDLLPNTYYLKLYRVPLEVRLLRGYKLLSMMILDHVLLLLAIGAGVGVLVRYGRDRGLARRLMLPSLLLLAAFAYSVYVGGDAWDMQVNMRANRFIAYVMPQLFVLFAAVLNQLADRMAARPTGDGLGRHFVVAAATALAFLIANGLWMADQDTDNWQALAVTRSPYEMDVQAAVYEKLLKLERALGPTGVVSTSSAGLPAFFTDYQMVDVLGYNERHIARLAPAIPLGPDTYMNYVPGHVKWDYPYVILHYHPDALLQPWGTGVRLAWLTSLGYRREREGDFWILQRPAAPGAAVSVAPGAAVPVAPGAPATPSPLSTAPPIPSAPPNAAPGAGTR